MSINDMTIEQLEAIEITSVAQGKQLAEDLLTEQKALHRQMIGLYDNEKWQTLCDRRYDLRKLRFNVLHTTGLMAIAKKRAAKR